MLKKTIHFKLILNIIGSVGLIMNHISIAMPVDNIIPSTCFSTNPTLTIVSTLLRSLKYYEICHILLTFIYRKKLATYGIQKIIQLIFHIVFISFVFASLVVTLERVKSQHDFNNHHIVYKTKEDSSYLSTGGIFDGMVFTIVTMLSLGISFSELQNMAIESIVTMIILLLISISLVLNYFFTVANKPKVDINTFHNIDHKDATFDHIEFDKSLSVSLKKWYLLNSIPTHFKNDFLIVSIFSGIDYLDIEHVKQLLEEAFNDECENSEHCKIVIMSTQTIPPSNLYAWNRLMTRETWRDKVVFICGSGMLTHDLERCGVDYSEQIYIVNGASNSTSGEKAGYSSYDDRVILQTEFVRGFNTDVEIYSEIYCPENRYRVLEAGADHVMCILGISYQIIGRMINCPGIDQLLLWTNFYPAVFPKEYYGLNFPIAAGKVYAKFGVIPFAVVACFPHINSDKYHSKYNIDHLIINNDDGDMMMNDNRRKNDVHRRLLLNPLKLCVTCTRLIYCFAPDSYAMYNFVTNNNSSENIKMQQVSRNNILKSRKSEKMHISKFIFDGEEAVSKKKSAWMQRINQSIWVINIFSMQIQLSRKVRMKVEKKQIMIRFVAKRRHSNMTLWTCFYQKIC
jgi:hypothetical protein